MRQSKIKSSCISGLEICPLDVEVSLTRGLPYYQVVGLGDSAVRESSQRVRLALKSSGFFWPDQRVTVNLSPAWLSKKGTAFDLPIALGILQALGLIPPHLSLAAWGELGSDGKIKSVPAALCYADALTAGSGRGSEPAAASGSGGAKASPLIVIQPKEAEEELVRYHSGGIYAANLHDLLDRLNGPRFIADYVPYTRKTDLLGRAEAEPLPDQAEQRPVKLQEAAWKAVMIAAAGAHHLLLLGAAGCGKTTLARASRYLLPPLDHDDLYRRALNCAFCSMPAEEMRRTLTVPFRAPHYSITPAGLLGGSRSYPLGEVSLADRGILFLDEISEYSAATLNMLRQPLEDHFVRRHRDGRIVQYPARFILLAAANPCPCGLLFEKEQHCTCAAHELRRYEQKFANPFFDRIDLQTEMLRLETAKLSSSLRTADEDISSCRQKVMAARERQWDRQGGGRKDLNDLNGWIDTADLSAFLAAEPKILHLAEDLADSFKLSVRSYQKLLRVARTIADLAGEEKLGEEHLLEAFTYKRHGQTSI